MGELRTQRQALGLSQGAVALAAGLSQPALSRVERRVTADPRLVDLWSIAAVLGLDLRLNAYPGGEPVRDHVQIRLLPEIRARVPSMWPWLTEVPLPIAGDRRAWDAVAISPDGWTAFEAISRLGARTPRFGESASSSVTIRGSDAWSSLSPTRTGTAWRSTRPVRRWPRTFR